MPLFEALMLSKPPGTVIHCWGNRLRKRKSSFWLATAPLLLVSDNTSWVEDKWAKAFKFTSQPWTKEGKGERESRILQGHALAQRTSDHQPSSSHRGAEKSGGSLPFFGWHIFKPWQVPLDSQWTLTFCPLFEVKALELEEAMAKAAVQISAPDKTAVWNSP